MSAMNTNKIKSALSTIKDKTENEEDRKKGTENLLREEEDKLDKFEKEIKSLKRRIQLVHEQKERADKAYEVSAKKLEESKQKCQTEEDMRLDLESTDRDHDDEMSKLKVKISGETQRAEEEEGKLIEVMQKLKVVKTELQKATECGAALKEKTNLLEDEARTKGENIRDLEERDVGVADKEQDSEEKITLFQGLLSEANQRIEDAQRKVPPIQLCIFELINETADLTKKKEAMEEGLRNMEDFAEDIYEED